MSDDLRAKAEAARCVDTGWESWEDMAYHAFDYLLGGHDKDVTIYGAAANPTTILALLAQLAAAEAALRAVVASWERPDPFATPYSIALAALLALGEPTP